MGHHIPPTMQWLSGEVKPDITVSVKKSNRRKEKQVAWVCSQSCTCIQLYQERINWVFTSLSPLLVYDRGIHPSCWEVAYVNLKKNFHDRKAHYSHLEPRDRVLVRNLPERGGPGKLRGHWADQIHVVVEQKGGTQSMKLNLKETERVEVCTGIWLTATNNAETSNE